MVSAYTHRDYHAVLPALILFRLPDEVTLVPVAETIAATKIVRRTKRMPRRLHEQWA